MGRTFKQIIQSQEEDSFFRNRADLAITGTCSVSIAPDADKKVFVSDMSVFNTEEAVVSVLNGTAFLYRTNLPASLNPPFVHAFQTPLKGSEGTTITAKVEGIEIGTTSINLGGYTAP